MKTKTLVQQAMELVPNYAQSYEKLNTRLLIERKSVATIKHYQLSLAAMSLHYGRLPEDLEQEELDSYLASPIKTGHASAFKHLVCALRRYLSAMGIPPKQFELPPVKKEKKLPEVLNHDECRRLFDNTRSLQQKVVICLMYSAGLRVSEVCSLRIKDIDSERMMIFVCQGKGRKDGYVPLSHLILTGLRKYWPGLKVKPVTFLFAGSRAGTHIGVGTVNDWIVGAARRAGPKKRVSSHTLRHSYGSHSVEMGMPVHRLKERLGHSDIRDTVRYLHLINIAQGKDFSPFDRLYERNR